jgi:hypothetical protein
MEKFILRCSKGLAEKTKTKDQTIQFIHESVQVFLLGGNGLSRLQSHLGNNPAGLSHEQCCQNYLKIKLSHHFPINSRGRILLSLGDLFTQRRVLASEKFLFLDYAVHSVLPDANAAEDHGISQKIFLERFSSDLQSGFRYLILLNNLFERYRIPSAYSGRAFSLCTRREKPL